MPRNMTLYIRKRPPHILLRINNVSLSIRKRPEPRNGKRRPKRFGDLPPLIREHEKVQSLHPAKFRLLLHAVDAHPDDLGVEFLEGRQIFLKAACFQGASAGEGAGKEVEDGPFAGFGESVEGYGLAAGVEEGEFRCRCAEGEGGGGTGCVGEGGEGECCDDGGSSVEK